MIRGIGIDAVEISRMEKSLKTKGFKESVFTSKEIENEHGNLNEYYATRFACKEAVYKALNNKNIDLRTIETLNNKDGSPYVVLKDEYECERIFVSISTEANLAIAYVILQ